MKRLGLIALALCVGCTGRPSGNMGYEGESVFRDNAPRRVAVNAARNIGSGNIYDYIRTPQQTEEGGDNAGFDSNDAYRSREFARQLEAHRLQHNKPQSGRAYFNERQIWVDNSYASPQIFTNPGAVQREILDRTRGANFYNEYERQRAHDIALQVRERAWNQQVRQWNAQIEANRRR